MRSRRSRLGAGVLACLLPAALLTACSEQRDGSADAGPAGSAPASGPASPPRPSYADTRPRATLSASARPRAGLDEWDVGSEVLPLRPDGYGVVRSTPPELRVRRLATTDLLPPPPDDRFDAEVRPVTPAWVRRTSLAWEPGCPVGLADLRLLRVVFRGFDGLPHTGQLVVHRREARGVLGVFRALYEADYPIEQIALARMEDLDAPPTGDGNVTGAYACRASRGSGSWSAHAYGLAVDVNPFMNPYVDDDLVLPELASAYTRREWRRPGMIRRGDLVVRAFARIGWSWGGDFRSVSDPMHFTATGR